MIDRRRCQGCQRPKWPAVRPRPVFDNAGMQIAPELVKEMACKLPSWQVRAVDSSSGSDLWPLEKEKKREKKKKKKQGANNKHQPQLSLCSPWDVAYMGPSVMHWRLSIINMLSCHIIGVCNKLEKHRRNEASDFVYDLCYTHVDDKLIYLFLIGKHLCVL